MGKYIVNLFHRLDIKTFLYSYAPFSSLAPRISYFDEAVVYGPSPGAYDPPNMPVTIRNSHKAALFGKSKAPRFKHVKTNTPGPGSYVIPGSLKKKSLLSPENRHPHGGEGVIMLKPVAGVTMTRPTEVEKQDGPADGKIIANEVAAAAENTSNEKDLMLSYETPQKSRKMKAMKELLTEARQSNKKDESKQGIVWRRKYVPPSIPVGQSAFGYQENEGNYIHKFVSKFVKTYTSLRWRACSAKAT
jgi:hypothetical protein